MQRPRLFLDANILVDAQVRDIFLTIAEARLIDLRWSEAVLDETRRVLANHIPPIIRRLVAELRKPPITVQEFVDRLAQRAPAAAQALSVALGETPEQ